MQTVEIKVEGMSCSHCVNAITQAVKGLKGVLSVDVSLDDKKVTVAFHEAEIELDQIRNEIEDQGYDVV